jgi:hypothetical protein
LKPPYLDDDESIDRPILFTKPGCEKCEWVKGQLSPQSINSLTILNLDGDDAHALGTLAYFSLVTVAEKHLPILLTKDLEIVIDTNKIVELLGGIQSGNSSEIITEPIICDDDSCRLNL